MPHIIPLGFDRKSRSLHAVVRMHIDVSLLRECKGFKGCQERLDMPLARAQAPRQQFVIPFVVGFCTACLALWFLRPAARGSDILATLSGTQLAGSVRLWQADDAKYLGPQKGDTPPTRLDSYKYKTNEYQEVYDKSWLAGGYPKQSCWGCRFGVDVIARLPFHSVLDAGTGNGGLVRLMREHGKSAWGIELSDAVLKSECPDLLKKKVVEAGVLTNLPYANNTFDLVFSADVLEHIHEDEADAVVRELVRVSRRHLFLSISLKPHTKVSADNPEEANRHTMLRSRKWWEDKFARHGADVNHEMLWAMQYKNHRFVKKDMRDCRKAGSKSDGGQFEVCIVDDTWLVGKPEQANVRLDRCITTENDELEPWFFSFRKKR